MKNTVYILIFSIAAVGLFVNASVPNKNKPTDTFEYFWKTFDERYALFEAKGINWREVHDRFAPRVNDAMSDEELYKVLTAMIVELNDNHVTLYPTNGDLPAFPGGVLRFVGGKLTILKAQEDYDVNVVSNYVQDLKEITPAIRYGHLTEKTGYITISGHTDSRKTVSEVMDKILQDLATTERLVVDVRGDYGGHDAIAQYMAGNFTTESILYMTTRKKNGPGRNDFTRPTEWYAQPRGHYPYTKPVILLTSRFTQSAGETFTLAMKSFPHVTVIGDTTAGSYSDNPTTELPNGWMVSLSIGDYRAADGRSYEGIGTAPHILMVNTKENLLTGKDATLEKILTMF